MKVTLTQQEFEAAIDLGIRREMYWHIHGIDNRQRRSKRSGWAVQIMGAISELAVCKHFRVEPDMSAILRPDEIDCVIKGKTVDVKSIDRPNLSLISPPHKKKYKADIYILTYVKNHDVDILGWAYGDDLYHESTIQEHGYGPTHTIKQDDPLFHPM